MFVILIFRTIECQNIQKALLRFCTQRSDQWKIVWWYRLKCIKQWNLVWRVHFKF